MRTLALLLCFAASSAFAQAWPSKPVRVIVGYAPGGGHDFVSRTVAARLADKLGQPFVVENRPGASGAIATDLVAKSAPDGHTFIVASPAEVLVGPIAGQKVPYDVDRDLAAVGMIGETPQAIVVHPSVPANTIQELIALAKKQPGKLSYGTPGEALKALAGIYIVHIPYKGAAPAVADLLGGQVEINVAGMPPVIPHHKSGKLRILAVTSEKRSAATPDIPAVAELPGFKGFHFTNWQGIYVAAKTPQPVIERLSAEISAVVKEPAIREKLIAAGVDPLGLSPSEFAAFLAKERATYTRIAKERGIKAD